MTGYCKAAIFHTNVKYIRRRRGNEGIILLNKILKEMGVDLNAEKIEAMKPSENIPLELRVKFLEACLKLFDNDTAKLRAMGREAPKDSLIVRLFLGYFMSPNGVIKHAPALWKEHYSEGELFIVQNDPNVGRLGLRNFKYSKLMCIYLCGYFEGVGDVTRAKNISCRETKCVHEGADYCEFEIKWTS